MEPCLSSLEFHIFKLRSEHRLCSISHRTHRSESLSGNFLKGVSRQSGEVFVEVPVLFWSLSWSTFPLISIFALFEDQDLRDDRLMISPPSLLQITLKITLDIVVSRWSFFLGLWGWVWWSRNALQKIKFKIPLDIVVSISEDKIISQCSRWLAIYTIQLFTTLESVGPRWGSHRCLLRPENSLKLWLKDWKKLIVITTFSGPPP